MEKNNKINDETIFRLLEKDIVDSNTVLNELLRWISTDEVIAFTSDFIRLYDINIIDELED